MASTGPKGINWDAIPLGKVTDADAARMAGTTALSAGNARRARGIPAHGGSTRKRPDIDWSNVPLGEKPDHVIAEELGVSIGTVVLRRQSARIQAHRKQAAIDWQAEKRLGVLPDRELAAALGCSVASVTNARHRLGIKSAEPRRSAAVFERNAKIMAMHQANPSLSTRDLAEVFGVRPHVIANTLAKLGRKRETPYERTMREQREKSYEARYAAWLKTPEGMATSAAVEAAHPLDDDAEEYADEMGELRKAALSNGQP